MSLARRKLPPRRRKREERSPEKKVDTSFLFTFGTVYFFFLLAMPSTYSPDYFFFPIFCHQLAAMTQIRTLRKKNPKAKSLHSLRRSVSLSKTGNDERRGEEDLPQWGSSSSDDVIYCGWIWMHLLLPFDLLFKICIFFVLQSYAEEGWGKAKKLQAEEEAQKNQSPGVVLQQWEGV